LRRPATWSVGPTARSEVVVGPPRGNSSCTSRAETGGDFRKNPPPAKKPIFSGFRRFLCRPRRC
jgi:hypothetical protein